MIAHLNLPIPTFFSVAPELVAPAGLEEIVRKCLSKSPADRYPDMQALMDELALCLNVPPEQFRSVSQSHSTIQRQISIPGTGRRLLVLALALLMTLAVGSAVVAGGLYLAATRNTSPPDPESVVDALQPPVPIVVPLPAPEPVVEPAPEPSGTAEVAPPEPAPEPVAAPRPRPRPRPRPAPVVTAAPEPQPQPAPAPEPSGPEGYMGLPDDFDKP
jgi:serine/threonine protein kinase